MRVSLIGQRAEFARRQQQVVVLDESREVSLLDVAWIEIAMHQHLFGRKYRQDFRQLSSESAWERIDDQNIERLIAQRLLNEVGHLTTIK